MSFWYPFDDIVDQAGADPEIRKGGIENFKDGMHNCAA